MSKECHACAKEFSKLIHKMEIGKFDLDAMNGTYYADYTEVIMNWFRSV